MFVPTDVVQFREDREVLEFLRAKGINPNEFAREAFETMLRRLRAQEAADELAKMDVRLPKSAQDVIREDRDAR